MKKENIFLFVLILILFFSLYVLFSQIISFNSPPIILEQKNTIPNENITSYPSGKLQYYNNMKFNHNNITYSIDSSCNEKEIKRVQQALDIIEKNIEIISFSYSNNGDIEIICENKNIPLKENGYFIAGEGGPTSVINTSLFYIIEKGAILIYQNKDFCNYPNVELHELLHVFGFEHSDNKNSIMYPVSSCSQILTEDIKNELKRLYEIENLPELYFSEINVKKHGNYIDFELKIKNSGLIKAENVKLEIKNYDKKIEEFDIENIDYGEGKYLKVENLKIPLRTKNIRFEIINGKEINNENNIAEFEID